MPSQLVKNSAVSFICARDFLYNGVEYKIGEDFDQDLGVGQIDLLIRTRRLFAVVDSNDDKPRHWHHHVWEREVIKKKLGVLKNSNAKNLTGSSGYNKYVQMGLDQPSASLDGKPAPDEGQMILDEARANAATETVLEQENEDGKFSIENQEIPVEPVDEPNEPEDEREITEDDLYDPSDYGVPEVLEYLTGDITDEERDRVLAVEKAGKARKGILNV